MTEKIKNELKGEALQDNELEGVAGGYRYYSDEKDEDYLVTDKKKVNSQKPGGIYLN